MTAPTAENPEEDGLPVMRTEGLTFLSISRHIAGVSLRRRTGKWWLLGFAVSFGLTIWGLFAVAWVLDFGPGVWGVNIPVAWGFAITNYVWWIGIGNGGTLISAFLLLLHQEWRTSVNRFAEAMTIFAVSMAGLFPLLHLGRQWKWYYLVPYPNSLWLWPQWRSALVIDAFAVLTYLLLSTFFWYMGLLPDLATARDLSRSKWGRRVYGVFALGWRGSAKHWQRHQMVYLMLAGLVTPLVVTVHSVVSLDFAQGIVPGWHTTIFPPYFVAGAVFSGFAMVLTIVLPFRHAYGFGNLITDRHLDNMGKVMLVSGLIVAYGYLMETFTSLYSGDRFEQFQTFERLMGSYRLIYWCVLLCNVAVIQLLWFPKLRRSAVTLWIIAMLVNFGMWIERYVIVVVSLHRDFLPSAWGMFYPTIWDYGLLMGTLGLFAALIFITVRLIPAISISESRELLHDKTHHELGGEAVTE